MRKQMLPSAFITAAIIAACLGIGVGADVTQTSTVKVSAATLPASPLSLSMAPLPSMGTPVVTAKARAQAGGSQQSQPATVETDKGDYQPGETVKISGAGFLPGEVVILQVSHVSGFDDGAGHEPFYTLSYPDGSISDQWYVHPDDSLHSIFILSAEGETSGRRAITIFTDAFFFINDDAGVDDINSNQVDLNQMGTDEVNLPINLGLKFNWDDTGWTGGNTGDACALFDTGGNAGRADFSLCVKVGLSPAVFQATSLWSCNDSRSDRCAGQALVWSTLAG